MDPSPEVMLTFYRRLYPFKAIYNWLNHEYAPSKLFTQREFSFTLAGDVYLRYQSFNSHDDLKKQVCQLNPTRFEIGPIYSSKPRDKKTARAGGFHPILRELVFDIDMTDYDPIRTCCSGAGICKRCWAFISAAVHVLDTAIREQFGYEQLLWVYSGRRGIHLWISDKEAMELTDQQRKALVGWLTVIQGGKESKKLSIRNGMRSLPPSLQSILDHLATVFSELILADQNCFGDKDGAEALLQLIPDAGVVEDLRNLWLNDPSRHSEDRWQDFKAQIKACDKGSQQRLNLTAAMEDIIIQYTYPRLDAEVSKHRNHLLKAPFCVHPKTGRICVPVDPKTMDDFDPETVPTVGQLLRELDGTQATIEGEQGEGRHAVADWSRTSLKPYVEMLDNHAKEIMGEVRREKRAAPDESW